MPYRRLPNTDKARIRSLETAIAKIRNSDYYAPVLSPELLSKAEKKLSRFNEAVERYNKALETQVSYSKSEAYQNKLPRKAAGSGPPRLPKSLIRPVPPEHRKARSYPFCQA